MQARKQEGQNREKSSPLSFSLRNRPTEKERRVPLLLFLVPKSDLPSFGFWLRAGPDHGGAASEAQKPLGAPGKWIPFMRVFGQVGTPEVGIILKLYQY
jgi:hypothetical protein